MAEEESFTFVDKRRVQADPPAETPAPLVVEAPAPAPPSAVAADPGPDGDDFGPEDDLEGAEAPGTYELIGYCVNLLASQAWQKLGLLADPQTGEARPDLAEAKLAIDVVGDLAARLETAPEAVISPAMRRDLRTLLNDLRLNYVAQQGQSPLTAGA